MMQQEQQSQTQDSGLHVLIVGAGEQIPGSSDPKHLTQLSMEATIVFASKGLF